MATNLILFINAMGEVFDLPHLYRHLGISLSMWVLTICLVLLDLVDGVHTARVLHQRIHSHKLRATVVKFGEYWRFLLFGFFFDLAGVFFPWYGYPYMTIIITLGLSVIELKSMLEHAKKRKQPCYGHCAPSKTVRYAVHWTAHPFAVGVFLPVF